MFELADVHRVQRRIPSRWTPAQDVRFSDWIVVQHKLGNVFLVGDDVSLQLKGLVAEVGDEKAVVVGPARTLPRVDTISASLPFPM